MCVYFGYDTFIPIHILWIGMALVTMYVINAYQRKGDPVYSHSFHSRRAFSSCTLVIKWCTSVIRGVGVYVTKYLKEGYGLQLHSKKFGLKQLCTGGKTKVL